MTDDPDQAAAWLAVQAPGPDTVTALSLLDPATLSHGARVDALVALERQAAWLAGMQAQLLAVMAAEDNSQDRWVREEVGCALRLSGLTAQRRLAIAQTLTGVLAETGQALHRGRIGYLHAMTLAEAVYPLDASTATAVQARVLPRAGGQTLAEFKRSVRRAVHALDPARVEEQRAQAMTERRVCVSPREDGMTELWALLPADGAAAVLTAIDTLASITSATDPRTADQRRADALVDFGIAALHDPHLPKAKACARRSRSPSPPPPCSASTSSPANSPDTAPSPPRWPAAWPPTPPAPGAAYSPTPPPTPCSTTAGPPTDPRKISPTTSSPATEPAPSPNCPRAAHHCDLDHRTPYDNGGTTSPQNLQALCRRHHRLKHQTRWKLQRNAEGSYHWTSPTAHTYQSRPPDLPADTTTNPDPPPF